MPTTKTTPETPPVQPGANPDPNRRGTSTNVPLPAESTTPIAEDQVVSPSIDIAYPLTNPAAKQQADRLKQEESKGSAKPFPVGSTTLETAPPAPVQTTEQFEESGGMKVTDNDVSKIESNTSGTEEKSAPAKTDGKTTDTKSALAKK